MQLKYFFRKPIFPIICDIDGELIAAKSGESFFKKLSTLYFNKTTYNIIDRTGEGWALYTEQDEQEIILISPLAIKKKWTKLDIIQLYNNRKNKVNLDEKPYSEKSLSSKRFDKIMSDIVALTLKQTTNVVS